MESLLLFRRALTSPTMCRFIPALSVTGFTVNYSLLPSEKVDLAASVSGCNMPG